MTMEVENEEDEKFETHPNKDVIKREPLRALCGIPEHVMKTRTSRERKPSKFKVSQFVHNLRKMGKCQVSKV
ncbi:hypothetical protein CK203_090784 [Vitis vinifera]|uniref:Uncharacterized protein n=1 Tax=Vitis vinifera TaxID=29760 RepID=A0A438BU05_VITVI|nr:hypothetical protein CK203_090784 [Vitis vinifera]